MAVNRIRADADDVGIVVGELGQILTVRRHFVGSSWAPIQRVKRHHYVLLAPVIAELDFMTLLAGHGGVVQIRRFCTRLPSLQSLPQRAVGKYAWVPCRQALRK